MAHLTSADSPTKLCIEFSSGNTVYLDMKEIGRRRIPSRELSNSHFPPYFYCSSAFLPYTGKSPCIITTPIPSLDQYVFIWDLLDGSVIAKLGPDKISFFNRSRNLCSSGFHGFCVSSISYFLDSVNS